MPKSTVTFSFNPIFWGMTAFVSARFLGWLSALKFRCLFFYRGNFSFPGFFVKSDIGHRLNYVV